MAYYPFKQRNSRLSSPQSREVKLALSLVVYNKIKYYVWLSTNVKKCKAEYYSNLINTNKGNTGAYIRQTLKDISFRKSHSSPSCINAKCLSYRSKLVYITESLNNHFSSIGSKLATNMRNLFLNWNSIRQTIVSSGKLNLFSNHWRKLCVWCSKQS